jgi:quercetin dioxygenase-like cupin family protein
VSDVRLERWDPSDGPLSERRLMMLLEQEGYEVTAFTYREGTVFPEHAHAQDKCDAVLSGTLRVGVSGEVFDLESGDRIYLPAGTRHSAEVLGSRTVFSLDGTLW